MADYILTTGDMVMFMPSFGAATVVVQPGTLAGTGRDLVGGKAVCVEGDEAKVMVPGCTYMTPVYSIPGVGTLSISSLGSDQTAKQTKCDGKAVLLKGGNFNAKFQVMVPAQLVTPAGVTVVDSTPEYSGNGSFITTNVRTKGT